MLAPRPIGAPSRSGDATTPPAAPGAPSHRSVPAGAVATRNRPTETVRPRPSDRDAAEPALGASATRGPTPARMPVPGARRKAGAWWRVAAWVPPQAAELPPPTPEVPVSHGNSPPSPRPAWHSEDGPTAGGGCADPRGRRRRTHRDGRRHWPREGPPLSRPMRRRLGHDVGERHQQCGAENGTAGEYHPHPERLRREPVGCDPRRHRYEAGDPVDAGARPRMTTPHGVAGAVCGRLVRCGTSGRGRSTRSPQPGGDW
ncbi:MAG: hypothetical protein AVDCRST_MAG49-3101 [uncultured Thermomicrobiales bacterium]|uniref:Uncharacterized protein n=1 Tax=uncultured Thermomicrobiales bacterium TaxID=1645740 RepID=A0A6J4V1N2_9BACT|nr:MAG: hypothetical protein AVDCRST_MAG49-3101 [uncultured Thermomicrobiales bacterium]